MVSTTRQDEGSVLAALRDPRRLRTEVLAGLVVALAFVGGRRAMISAATGAVALVVAPVVAEHGVDYLIATVILAGVLQVLLSVAGVAKLMRFIPRC